MLRIIHTELTLTDRTYICKRCEMVKDRDVNAATNLDTDGRAHPEPTDACGQERLCLMLTMRQPAWTKQEAKEVQ